MKKQVFKALVSFKRFWLDRRFVAKHVIKPYECGDNAKLKISALMNLLQDASEQHVVRLGLGIDFCLEKKAGWMVMKYDIEIIDMPAANEKVTITTWTSSINNVRATRDTVIKGKNGRDLIRATSQWVLVCTERRRPVSLAEYLPPTPVVEERLFEKAFEKIEKVKRVDFSINYSVKVDYIDMNKHVNNALYPVWASEAVSDDYRLNHVPERIRIDFCAESLYRELVEISSQIDDLTTVHNLWSKTSEKLLARVKINWV